MTAGVASTLQRFVIEGLRSEPWKNGAGVTRTVMCSDAGAAGTWRISVADITREAAFSRFPGLDREALLIHGRGVTLQAAGQHAWSLTAVGDAVAFPGELPVVGRPHDGPARLWNVMADRAQVRARTVASRALVGQVGAVQRAALLVLAGQAHVAAVAGGAGEAGGPAMALSAGEGLVLRDLQGPLALRFEGPSAHWLLTTFEER